MLPDFRLYQKGYKWKKNKNKNVKKKGINVKKNRFKKLKLKRKKKGNTTELQKPNIEAEVYNNKKCD